MNKTGGFFLVVLSGIFWSSGAPLIRLMDSPENYRPQYLFYRGIAVMTTLFLFLLAKEGIAMKENFKRIGGTAIFGAISLASAFVGFIFSITFTTVAVTLFMLALMPFIASIIAFVFLKESLRRETWIAMFIALAGILIMVSRGKGFDDLQGMLMALGSSLGFAIFSVTLRKNPETPKFTTTAVTGIFCCFYGIILIFIFGTGWNMPPLNIILSMIHGSLVSIGLILFTYGAKYLSAADLTLLSLLEIVFGILWVWLPVFGIHEVPSNITLFGGSLIMVAVIYNGQTLRKKYQTPTL